MSYVIRCLGFSGIATQPGPDVKGSLLKAYDPEAHDGRGWAEWTHDLNQAREFDSPTEAWFLWRAIPKSRRLREDGMANRPLTAFTVEIIERSLIS